MATEKRLIDVEHLRRYALYEYMRAKMKNKDDYHFEHWAGIVVVMIEELLKGMPTVDAVEVVRCKDCKDHDRCEVEDLLVKFLCIENAYCAAGEEKWR